MQPKTRLYRFFEILPGTLMWLTFILPVALAFTYPRVVSLAIMIYALLWFFKTVVMSRHLILGYYGYRDAMKKNWYHEMVSSHPKEWERVTHVAFVPMYKESFEIVAATFDALIASDYPLKKVIPILCTEGRAGEEAQEVAKKIKKKYAHYFPHFFVTVHPADIPGEVKGKGPNMNWAAKEVIPQLLSSGYKAKDILVTTLDADNRVDRHYFACVTKAFLESPDPAHTSYQPLPMYFNNIWDVPLFVRMIALGSSFWVMVQATRADRLRNFSAHSQSLEGLIEADYWSSTSIVEDGHQYWRSLYAFNGNHTVVPIFVPIYQDAVLGATLKDTIKEQYLQKRRWAWGVSDVAYVFTNNLKDSNMSFWEKWKQFFILLEGHYSWATTSLVLALGGWPPLLINAEYQNTVFAYNFPFFYSKILLAAGIGMIITLVISTLVLPPPPRRYKNHKLIVIRDWILTPIILPITNIFLGALPAIDSQTRLMFGRYLEFRVTVKRMVDTVVTPETKKTPAPKSAKEIV
ncbi:MAG TPA: glycosyltransferase family 2 protein [Patescibacteria group bacterium]